MQVNSAWRLGCRPIKLAKSIKGEAIMIDLPVFSRANVPVSSRYGKLSLAEAPDGHPVTASLTTTEPAKWTWALCRWLKDGQRVQHVTWHLRNEGQSSASGGLGGSCVGCRSLKNRTPAGPRRSTDLSYLRRLR